MRQVHVNYPVAVILIKKIDKSILQGFRETDLSRRIPGLG